MPDAWVTKNPMELFRLDGNVATSPHPYPASLIETLREILGPRVARVAPDELANFRRVFDNRAQEWKRSQRTRWQGIRQDDVPLLTEAGSYVDPHLRRVSWSTPLSMRNVDAECQAEITTLYLREE